MKTLVKEEWPAIVAATLIAGFVVCAVLSVVNLTEAGFIHWSK